MYMAQLSSPGASREIPPSATSDFKVDEALVHLAHWLPGQGPIKDFIHHNTLHALQHLPFHEAVALAAKILGARSYLPLADYQHRFKQGRIKQEALEWALARSGASASMQDTLINKLFEPDAASHYPPVSIASHGIRTAWLTQIEVNLNSLVHPVLFRLLGNFLDQGISRWTLPKEGETFWACVRRLATNSFLPLYPFHTAVAHELLAKDVDAALLFCLKEIVGETKHYEQYLLEMLLAHPGWSGMVSMIEQNPRALLAKRAIKLKELVAVELALEWLFLRAKRGANFAAINQVSLPAKIPLLADGALQTEVPMLLRIWHEAMEWSLHSELLAALQVPPQPSTVSFAKPATSVQALFCIDDRECSIRRYLEELDPSIETFGAAGFFGIDFLYQGLDDAYPVAQCPNIITPKHLIKESGAEVNGEKKPTSLKHMHFSAHSIFRGWLYTQTLGLGYAIRMAGNVFFPGSSLPHIRALSEVESHSQLHLLRESDELTTDGYLLGFSIGEMADRVGGLLRNIGLTQQFAPLVVIVAHGSSSVNNPHFAAYDCGACSGKPGAPNARAFAWMANHPEVRAVLYERGISIPATTHFVAALHNTSRDEITYFDTHLLAPQVAENLAPFEHTMQNALQLNAYERCRWFELSPKAVPLAEAALAAHKHVKQRASSIFEPRPEYNHSNNLYCIVGRREITRGLFLDRRAFLHSYAPDTDASGEILARILAAVIPVCGGINLEYLFSRIDNSVYGAGTKLPHNVIGLLGVANGVEGDLRTGLPAQMIEVHEPARLLIVIDQTPAVLDQAIAKLNNLREWLDNEWVRCVSCHPHTQELMLYNSGSWEKVTLAEHTVPTAADSAAVWQGQQHTLPVHQLRWRVA